MNRAHLKRRLEQKQWGAHEIERTLEGIRRAGIKEHASLHHLTAFLSILGMVIGNLIVALAVLPLLWGLEGFALYASIALLGLSLGFFVEILTRSIAFLEHHHHMFLLVLLPTVALLGMTFVALFANSAQEVFGFGYAHSPLLVGLVFGLCELLPYAYLRFVIGKHYYSG